MKAENVYRGDIFICTKYPDRYSRKQEPAEVALYKEDTILIKSGDQYIDLDTINSDLDLIKGNKKGLKTYYTYEGDKFVGNIRNYHFSNNEKPTVKSLKKNKNNY